MVKHGDVDYLKLVWVNKLAATDDLQNYYDRIQQRIALLHELEQHIDKMLDIPNLLKDIDG